jgi:hypothetical protein
VHFLCLLPMFSLFFFVLFYPALTWLFSCFRMFDIGFVSDFPVNVLDSTLKGSEETDFLRLYPLKTVSDVADLVDDGIFVLCGTIVDVIKGEDWWLATCQCHRTLRRSSGSFFCHSCVGPVLCYQLMLAWFAFHFIVFQCFALLCWMCVVSS